MLDERSAVGDCEQLHAATDSECRYRAPAGLRDQRKFPTIDLGIGIAFRPGVR
jgi:hypothetical protein